MHMKLPMLFTLAVLFACLGCAGSNREKVEIQTMQGILTGQVNIGPTRPVETKEATRKSNLYKGRSLLIYDPDDKLVKKLALADDGSFAVTLPEGEYRVEITLKGIERATGLPKTIRVQNGDTKKMVIDIDTGIR